MHAVNGVIIFTPAAATAPFFSALGLGAGGPVAGKIVSHNFIKPP